MEVVTDLREAIKRSGDGEYICWAINQQNRWHIFKICYYQAKYRTKKEFKCIHYQKSKDILYYWLVFISKISFGHYRVVYEYES